MRLTTTALVLIGVLAVLPFAVAQSPAPIVGVDANDVRQGERPAPTPSRHAADARHCLEFATNLEVIVCAEKYRPNRRSA